MQVNGQPRPISRWIPSRSRIFASRSKAGSGTVIEIADGRGVGIPDHVVPASECDARHAFPAARIGNGKVVQENRERVVRFAADDEVNARKFAHRCHVDDRGLRPTQDDPRIRVGSSDFPGQTQGEWVRAADGTEPENVE